jgi:hypothetical protein
MNNNRQQNNNNRRRGRNNNNTNRPQNNRSGVDYQNAIDNRARGNASQMLEKYKKLASDAQHNDDRVNAEYYLQFADHYFRVLADFRSRQEARQEEQASRRPRDEWRDDERDDGRNDGRNDGGNDSGEEQSESIDSETISEESDAPSKPRPRSDNRNDRENRNERNERPNRNQRPRHHSEESDEIESVTGGIDLNVLPPAIAISSFADDDDAGNIDEVVKERAPRRPRAPRRAKASNDEDVVTAAE